MHHSPKVLCLKVLIHLFWMIEKIFQEDNIKFYSLQQNSM